MKSPGGDRNPEFFLAICFPLFRCELALDFLLTLELKEVTMLTPDALPAKDRLLSRPDKKALPTRQDPKAPRGYPADPKENPNKGRDVDPKAYDIDYTA